MATIPTGRFVWFEYVSKDDRRAQAFFGELFHWQTKEVPLPHGNYTMITTASGHDAIGGYLQPLANAPQQPYWLPHLQVSSAQETAMKVRSLGGRIVRDAVRIGDIGTMAVVTDPLGSLLALWQPARADGSGNYRGSDGSWIWNELRSEEPDRSIAFYRAIAGFEIERRSVPDRYDILKTGNVGRGGIARLTNGTSARWMPFVKVADADAICARVRALGGSVTAMPERLPGLGRVATFTDPLGAAIGVMQPAS